jgi:tetratricopeptide (TPR) repeat protein
MATMNKHFLLLALLTLAVGGAIAVYTHSEYFWNADKSGPVTDSQLAEFAAKLGQTNTPTQSVLAPLDLSEPVRLAVGGLGLADNDQDEQLGDLITADLTGAPGFDLVERQSLAAILQELRLSWSGFVRAKDAVRVGKLLKVDWFLLGTEAKINGTNCLVVRVVDARTGIMRDAGVVSAIQSPVKLAADVAAFVGQSRRNAASAKTRVYLAVGAFEDLGVNNRLADFPTQLRGYLTAAYQHTEVTLLEREYVDALLGEVDLDLAGLTEANGTNPPPPMQSAFWLVSGQYQSYETTNVQVELNLTVQRVFGLPEQFTLRGLPGESIGGQVKTVIDGVMNQKTGIVIPTRVSEARAQMAIGKELAEKDPSWIDLVWLQYFEEYSDSEMALRRRNMEQAIRAFQTALLLDPTNQEAKMYLAACFRRPFIGRTGEARDYYREIIEEPMQDEWFGMAQQALVDSFERASPEEIVRWFQSAAAQTTNAVAATFYGKQAETAATTATINARDSDKVEELAEQRLFKAIQSAKNMIQGKTGTFSDDMGMDDYIKIFGSDRTTAAHKLVALLPEMENRVPDMDPYLLAAALTFQVDTNTPLAVEFQRTLNDCIEHPQRVLNPVQFWNTIRWSVYRWSFKTTNYSLAINLMEGERRVAAGEKVDFDDQEKIKLAYAYLAAQRWQDALDIFESFADRPVQTFANGPWGAGLKPVLTDRMAAFCREKLGLPVLRDPRGFDMGKPVLCFCNPFDAASTFIADDNGLWVGNGGWLLHLDLDLKTNLSVKLPMDDSVPITALCLTSSNIWIGTGGAGLIEFDKASQQCRHFTEKDGLLMDNISSLCLAGNTLWIGYGQRTFQVIGNGQSQAGGLGKLDVTTGSFASFTPSLSGSENGNSEKPTRRTVMAMAAGAADDIWFLTDEADPAPRLLRYQPNGNLWKVFQNGCTALAGNQKQIVLAQSTSPVLNILDFKDGQWRSLKETTDLPPASVSTLELDGNDLWIGGEGYIALVDLKEGKVRKFSHIQTAGVVRIQIGGGFIWAQFDWHLYRAPLGEMQYTPDDDSQYQFLQSNFAKLVPVQFQKDTNGMAALQRLRVEENMFEYNGMYYCGFKINVPPWLDGNVRLLYILAKSEAEKKFYANYMTSSIIPENGPSVGAYEFLRENVASFPRLQTQFPYTEKLTTQNFDLKRLEPGKTYGIWFEFDNKNMPDIAFAMTVNSPRGTNEFGMLPLR